MSNFGKFLTIASNFCRNPDPYVTREKNICLIKSRFYVRGKFQNILSFWENFGAFSDYFSRT